MALFAYKPVPIMGDDPQKVLIVEDNELNMKLFTDLLEAHHIQVVQSFTGKNVVALTRKHKPDLILMDIQLPERSGLDLIQDIKKHSDLDDIPVIAVTAFAMKSDEARIRKVGCADYIAKPIAVASFMKKINGYLAKQKRA